MPKRPRKPRRDTSTLVAAKPWEACFFHFVAGWEALQRGDLPKAALHAEQSLALGKEVGIPGRYLQQALLEERTRLVGAAPDSDRPRPKVRAALRFFRLASIRCLSTNGLQSVRT